MSTRNQRRHVASELAREIRRASRREGKNLSFTEALVRAHVLIAEEQRRHDNGDGEAQEAPARE